MLGGTLDRVGVGHGVGADVHVDVHVMGLQRYEFIFKGVLLADFHEFNRNGIEVDEKVLVWVLKGLEVEFPVVHVQHQAIQLTAEGSVCGIT